MAINGTVTVTLAEAVEAVEVTDFTVTQAIGEGEATEVTPSAAVLSEDGLTVTLTVEEVVQTDADQSVVYTVNGIATEAFVVVAEAVVELAVESVSAINGNTVVVTFNKELDTTVATNAANYTAVKISDNSLYTFDYAELSEDKMTVTLTNNTANLSINTDFSLNVKGLKEVEGTDLLNFAKAFKSIKDVVAPQIASASAKTGSTNTNTLTVKFNESIDTAGSKAPVFKVGGNIVAATQATDKRTFTVQLPTSVTSGTFLQVEASNVFDFAGNKGTSTITTTVAQDLAAPVVNTVEVVSDTVLKVKFNEAVASSLLTTGASGNVSVTADGMTDAVASVGSNAAGAAISGNVTEAYILLNAGTIYTSTIKSRNLNVTFKNLTDVYGNKSAVDNVSQIVISKDEVKPTVSSVTHKKVTTSSPNVSDFRCLTPTQLKCKALK